MLGSLPGIGPWPAAFARTRYLRRLVHVIASQQRGHCGRWQFGQILLLHLQLLLLLQIAPARTDRPATAVGYGEGGGCCCGREAGVGGRGR